MNDNIRTQVIDLLESTPTRLRDIELLRYELQHRAKVTENEMIDALTFGHADSESHAANSISDKTMRVALDYERRTAEANDEVVREIVSRLAPLEFEQERLEKYISYLDKKQADVIRMTYFDGMTNEAISTVLKVTPRTVRFVRSKAVDILCEMYELVLFIR